MWEPELKKQSCLHQTLKCSSRRDTAASWLAKIQIAKSARHRRHRGRNVANLTFLLRPFFFRARGFTVLCWDVQRIAGKVGRRLEGL